MSFDIEIPEAFEGFFTPSRYKAHYGGRGSAKSQSAGSASLIRGGQAPLRIACLRETQSSIKDSIHQLLVDKIAAHRMGGFYRHTETGIYGRNGTRFLFRGLSNITADQIKSLEGVDIALVEEAQNISRRSLEILIPTIRKPGSELWFNWNPGKPTDAVDARFRGKVVPEGSIIRKVNYDENPFFPAELEAERQYDLANNPERYGHIWLGEYEPMVAGAIFRPQMFAEHRLALEDVPKLDRIAVALDHAVSAEDLSNEHGIIVGGVNLAQREAYILDDLTCTGGPEVWAKRVVSACELYGTKTVIIERNQGGDLIKHTLETYARGLHIVEETANKSKPQRAQPVASAYALGRVHHVGTHQELEDQLCQFTNAGYEGEGSPDRADALVWLVKYLLPQVKPGTAQGPVKAKGTNFRVHGGGR